MQLRWPDSGCICPAGHGVQDCDDTPEVEEEPGGQTPSGAERPVAEQKLPAVQGLQADWPERSWKLPAAHNDGDIMPEEGQELPRRHGKHAVCPELFWNVPALHSVQNRLMHRRAADGTASFATPGPTQETRKP